jgi:tetratricopeptide (TPR) repeat protein
MNSSDLLIALYIGLALVGLCSLFVWLHKIDKRREAAAAKVAKEAKGANLRAGQKALADADYDLAISHANEEIRVNPANPNAYRMQGQAYHHKENYAQAISDFTKAIELQPEWSGFYKLRADS